AARLLRRRAGGERRWRRGSGARHTLRARPERPPRRSAVRPEGAVVGRISPSRLRGRHPRDPGDAPAVLPRRGLADRAGVMLDVIVVGAGPAGSAAAAILARRGCRVLALERAKFPRPK